MMNSEEIRLSKLIANYGNYSRRQVDTFITKGEVFVNGKKAVLGQKGTINDNVEINGIKVKFKTKHIYYAVNKPKGFICARTDEKGKEVISLVPEFRKRNLFTIGRLDVNTTGLIIVTTDGELAQKVNSPSHKIYKTYLVFLNKTLTIKEINNLKKGIELDDGYVTKPVKKWKLIKNEQNSAIVKMTIIEGKKNQIRRMFDAVDNPVINLKRIGIGYLELNNLPLGEYKIFKQKELYDLFLIKNKL